MVNASSPDWLDQLKIVALVVHARDPTVLDVGRADHWSIGCAESPLRPLLVDGEGRPESIACFVEGSLALLR